MRLRPASFVRFAVVCAIAASGYSPATAAAPVPLPGLTALAVATTSTPTVDNAATSALRASADSVRRNAGLETLYTRATYTTNAVRVATAAMNGQTPAPSSDDAPMSYVSGTATDISYAAGIDWATDVVVDAARTVLKYPLHTDGGWAVVTKRLPDGRIAYGVALLVGWPNPTVSRTTGCSSTGFCWSNGGLNPHLPWTRNTVKWYLSTSNLPSAGESLVKSAIAKVNATSRFGAHVVYGGKTTATAPSATRRFVIVFGSGCSSSSALGCTITSTQGTYRMVFQAKTIITLSRYRANPSTTWWIGTLMHEIGHGTGLGHYDAAYGGSYQLMRSANGPDYIKTGDANGLRGIAKPGNVTATLAPRRTLGGFSLAVRTANSGLGGVRAIRTQCTDSAGAWRTVATASGTWDGRTAERVVGTFAVPTGAARLCRAIVRSKTVSVWSKSVAVRG